MTATSAAIHSISYDPARLELTVAFANGQTFVHLGVPGAIASAFEASDDHTDFYAQHIRDTYRRIG